MSPLAWLAVGLLGGSMAGVRFIVDSEIATRAGSPFPLGILTVNLLGAFALGLVAGSTLAGEALTIVSGGLIGSLTTFSTWMLDTHRLRGAAMAHLAWLNIWLSLLAGFGAVALGHWIAS